jgi:hypothetical protein
MHREPPSPTNQVLIDLGDRSYAIDIGAGLLDESSAFAGLPRAAAALVQRLKRSLPDGEAKRTRPGKR